LDWISVSLLNFLLIPIPNKEVTFLNGIGINYPSLSLYSEGIFCPNINKESTHAT